MTTANIYSTNLPSAVAEIARWLDTAEAALSTPVDNVSISFGNALMTVTGSFPASVSINPSGDLVSAIANYTPDYVPNISTTALQSSTFSGLAEALFGAAIKLDLAETAYQAGGHTLPAGVGCSAGVTDRVASFTAVLPFTVSLDSSGNQVITVTDYLA